MEWLSDPAIWIGLATLIVLEIVLGIDNLVFIAILTERLPPAQRDRARITGLSLALLMRLGLLAAMSWLVTLTTPLFSVAGHGFAGRDLILLIGGLFLLFKATSELHERLEGTGERTEARGAYAGFGIVVTQIVLLDAVFSMDSVITAVGMVNNLPVMMTAVVIAMGVMLLASKRLTRFVNAHPTVVVLCLSFLLMIGLSLVAEGFGFHLPKGYLYAAIGFSIVIEFFNQLGRRNTLRSTAHLPMRERTAEAIFRMLGGTEGAAQPGAFALPAPPAGSAAAPGSARPEPTFGPEEREMVSGVLSLAERSIHSIMTPRSAIDWIDLRDPPEAIRAQLVRATHGLVPVCRGALDDVVGVARVHDLLADVIDTGHIDEAASLRPPLVVPASISVIRLMEMLRQSRGQMALVGDEYGSILGLVTPIDVLEAIAGEFPDVGEQPEIQAQGHGHWVVDGMADLHRLARATGSDLSAVDDAGYNTLAGLLLGRLGRLPQVGEALELEGLRFEVLALEGRRIARVDVRRTLPAGADLQDSEALRNS